MEKTLCPKAFLHDKLHTFLFDNIRNGNFSNTESLALALALAQNYGLKMGNSRIDQVRLQLLHTVFLKRSQAGLIEPVDLSTVCFID